MTTPYEATTDNLFIETVNILQKHNKTMADVKWVGSTRYLIDLDDFVRIAKETDYDGGYGSQEVAEDLLIVGDGWWLERGEYDGSEWWEYKETPTQPTEKLELKALSGPIGEKLGICEWYDSSLFSINIKQDDE